MRVGLTQLIDPGLTALVAETQAIYTAARAGRAAMPDPSTPEGLRQARSRRAAVAPLDPPAVETTARYGGSEVPVRIIRPATGPARAVLLDFHPGGFYLGEAARNDARNAQWAEALG